MLGARTNEIISRVSAFPVIGQTGRYMMPNPMAWYCTDVSLKSCTDGGNEFRRVNVLEHWEQARKV